MGSGTTLVEAKLLGRNAVGIDINPQSVSISETNLQFQCDTSSKIYIREGNAAELHFIKDAHIDFICTHPPYAGIIKYGEGIEGDISMLGVKSFIDAMDKVAYEAYRVLKKGKMCAVMIGDIRKCGKVVPLGFRMMDLLVTGKNRIIIFCFLHMSIYLSLRNNGSIWDLHGVKVLIVIFCVSKYNKFMGFCHLVTREEESK